MAGMSLKVNFASCVYDSEEYGSNDQQIVSRVFFNFWCEGLRYTGLHADIKHSVDGDLETDPLEITRPRDYDGPISLEAFQRAVGQYYRSLVGGGEPGNDLANSKTRMRDHTFLVPRSFEFPLGDRLNDGMPG